MAIKYPIITKIAFPIEHWPNELLANREEKIPAKKHKAPYTFEDIALLMLLCTETNTLGVCHMDMKHLLKQLGITATKSNIEKYAEALLRLLQRSESGDYVHFESVQEFGLSNLKADFEIRPVQTWHTSNTRFFTLSNVEFNNVIKCAIKYDKNAINMLAVFIALKSTFYTTEVNRQGLLGCVVAKETLAKRSGLSTRAVESYLIALKAEGIISWQSGKISGMANAYCLGGHEAVLNELMNKQMAYFISKGYKPQAHRFGIKRFEGAY